MVLYATEKVKVRTTRRKQKRANAVKSEMRKRKMGKEGTATSRP